VAASRSRSFFIEVAVAGRALLSAHQPIVETPRPRTQLGSSAVNPSASRAATRFVIAREIRTTARGSPGRPVLEHPRHELVARRALGGRRRRIDGSGTSGSTPDAASGASGSDASSGGRHEIHHKGVWGIFSRMLLSLSLGRYRNGQALPKRCGTRFMVTQKRVFSMLAYSLSDAYRY